jgi:hypothetical protein
VVTLEVGLVGGIFATPEGYPYAATRMITARLCL